MAKRLKGMFMDCAEIDQPENTYRMAKNIVDSNTIGAKENEDGFLELPITPPYTVHGVIPIESDFVVFGTNGVACEIGLIAKTGVSTYGYTAVYNNPDLNFDNQKPIKGTYRKDINGHRVVVWIDDINPPRILDIDNVAAINSVNDLELFQDIINPAVSSFAINNSGGALKTGTIIPITRYKNTDGSQTDWFVHEQCLYIVDDSNSKPFNEMDGSEGGRITNKSVSLTLSGCDTRYDTLVLGYVQVINGITIAYQIKEITNAATVNTAITGNEASTEISLDEVLVNTTNYNNAKAITQLSGRLFLGNMTADALPDLQAVACDIEINYNSELINVISNTGTHKDTLPPTLLPGEVYAFYLGVELNRGSWAFYHIPGRPVFAAENAFLSGYGLNYYKYQVDDTCNTVGALTNMGYWENENEFYPNTTEFSGTVSGEDLRGQRVRHHRMPTYAYLVNNIHSADSAVGITKLPRLYVTASNVNIPLAVQSKIKRWKIFYAKKTNEDSLYIADDLTQFSFSNVTSTLKWGTGGNWLVAAQGPSWGSFGTAYRDRLRGHAAAYSLDDSLPDPAYVQFAYKLRRTSLNTQYTGFRSSGGKLTISGQNRGSNSSLVVDYTVPSVTTRSAIDQVLGKVKVDSMVKLPQNAINNNVSTQYTEKVLDLALYSAIPNLSTITLGAIHTKSGGTAGVDDQMQASSGYTPGYDGFEETLYQQYFTILSDVHTEFTQQTLIPLNTYATPATTTATFYGGNGFMCYQSYLACGPLNSNPDSTLTDPYEEGIRAWKGYIGYSKYNLNFRHSTTGDLSTYYHGKNDVRALFTPYVVIGNVSHTILFKLDSSVNVVEYNTDYNYINELVVGTIWAPNLIQETSYPTTIVYTPVQSEDSKEFSWRTFLAADKYTLQKDKGEIVNLQGIANRELIIHTKYSIFKTRTDAQQAVDGESIYLKSANLFDLPPTELVPTPTGYGGTQNKMGCVLTKVGYAYVDDIQGKVFLYNGQLEEISAFGMRNFFRDFMNIKAGNDVNPNTDNTFTNNGYTIGYDERFNRLIVTKKYAAKSWTASYNPQTQSWTSFHSYIPDYMFGTTDAFLYGMKDNKFYLMNGPPVSTQKGVYFDTTINPSFIDEVFNEQPGADKEFTGVSWISEVYPNGITDGQVNTTLDYTATATHLTVRTSQHCTGRLPLTLANSVDSIYTNNIRILNGTWYFNNLRDYAIATGFVLGFYNNFAIDPTKLNTSMEWYDVRRFVDKYLHCRYEFDNQSNKRFLFLDNGVQFRYVSK